MNPNITSALPGKQRRKWKFFESFTFFEKLAQAFVSVRKHLTTFEEMDTEEVALDVFEILEEVRRRVESMVTRDSTSEIANLVETFFGRSIFKCSRPSCHFFEMGFVTSDLRNFHVDKHLRPFLCALEGCPTSAIGMATARDLDVHMRETHGVGGSDTIASDFPTEEELRKPSQTPEEFSRSTIPTETSESESERAEPQTVETVTSSRRQEPTKAKARRKKPEHICSTCSKSFTKRFNLQSHMRSVVN